MNSTVSSRLLRQALPALAILLSSLSFAATAQTDQLPSWNNGAKKEAVYTFLRDISNGNSADYVAPEKRVAVFDNDGTLWAEKPLYPQLDFLLAVTRERAVKGELDTNAPLVDAVLKKNFGYLKTKNTETLLSELYQSTANMSVPTYEEKARDFLTNGLNRTLQRPYVQTRYQPMLELMALLREYEFTIYIVTGGGEDFVRSISEPFYGVPADRVIGTRTKNRTSCTPQCLTLKGSELSGPLNVEHAKVERIEESIGIAPLVAVGNSMGDREMLAHTATQHEKSLAILLAHDDAAREFDYGEKDDAIIDIAERANWMVLSIASDFETVFVNP